MAIRPVLVKPQNGGNGKGERVEPHEFVPRKVFYATLPERNVSQQNYLSMLEVAARGGIIGAARINISYARTDWARDLIASEFLKLSARPEDTLIMLDDDHLHDPQTLERLTRWDKPIVGALAFRRGEPYYPCVFIKNPDDKPGAFFPMEWQPGLIECEHVGFAAVAIQRRVFESLLVAGFEFPWFRYEYPDVKMSTSLLVDGKLPPHVEIGKKYTPQSEDIYFCRNARKAGVKVYADMSLVAPHITDGFVDASTWRRYVEEHPEEIGESREFEMEAQKVIE